MTYSLLPMVGIAVHHPLSFAYSFVIIDQPQLTCPAFQGGVFITEDCKVIGVAVPKPILLVSTLYGTPVAKEIATHCVTFLIPFEV